MLRKRKAQLAARGQAELKPRAYQERSIIDNLHSEAHERVEQTCTICSIAGVEAKAMGYVLSGMSPREVTADLVARRVREDVPLSRAIERERKARGM